MTDIDKACPCSSGACFADCCEQLINGERESQSAEELMRARYSAFATGAINFIVASTHSRTRSEIDIDYIRKWSQTSTWRGLQIFDTKLINDNKAYVSFEALFTQAGKDQSHKEKAEFEREHGKWRVSCFEKKLETAPKCSGASFVKRLNRERETWNAKPSNLLLRFRGSFQ